MYGWMRKKYNSVTILLLCPEKIKSCPSKCLPRGFWRLKAILGGEKESDGCGYSSKKTNHGISRTVYAKHEFFNPPFPLSQWTLRHATLFNSHSQHLGVNPISMNNMTGSKFTTRLWIAKMHQYRAIDLVDLQREFAKSKPDVFLV